MDKRLKMQPTEVSVKDMIMEKMELENKVFDLESQLAALRERAGRLERAIEAACMKMGIMLGPLHPDQQPLRRDELKQGMEAVYQRLKSHLSAPAPAGEQPPC